MFFPKIRNFKRTAMLWAILGAGVAGVLPLGSPQLAHADRAFREDLVGTWITDANEHYVFRSNGTYTFTTGITGSGNVSHSGRWSLLGGGRTLRLHATRRVVLEGKRRRTLKANRVFRLAIENLDPETITLDKEEFHRPREGRGYYD